MKNLLNFLIVLLLTISFNGCNKKIYNETEVLGASMKIVLFLDNANQFQLDSLINADNLPSVDKWPNTSFVDYETNKRITKKTLVRNTKEGEIVYIITGTTVPYDIIKRIRR